MIDFLYFTQFNTPYRALYESLTVNVRANKLGKFFGIDITDDILEGLENK